MTNEDYKLFEANTIAKYGIMPLTGCFLSPIATKALLYLIWKCNSETPGVFDTVKLRPSELCEALGYTKDKNRNFSHNLKKVCDVIQNVMLQPFKICSEDGDKYISFTWIQTMAVDLKNDSMWIRFNTDLGMYFGSELQKSFTVVKLKYLNRLKTSAAVILYPFFCRYAGMGSFNYGVEDLTILLTGDKQCDYKHLKRNYLLPAIEAINTWTDIRVEFIENKKERRVSSLSFSIYSEPGLPELESYMEFHQLKPSEVSAMNYDEDWIGAYRYNMAKQKYELLSVS